MFSRDECQLSKAIKNDDNPMITSKINSFIADEPKSKKENSSMISVEDNRDYHAENEGVLSGLKSYTKQFQR